MSDEKKLDLNSLMDMAQEFQGDIARIQADLGRRTVEASSGGGMVTAVVNGRQVLLSLKVEKDVVDPGDVEMLQDLIVAAVNQAFAKMQAQIQADLASLARPIPGMPNLI